MTRLIICRFWEFGLVVLVVVVVLPWCRWWWREREKGGRERERIMWREMVVMSSMRSIMVMDGCTNKKFEIVLEDRRIPLNSIKY